MNKKLLLFVSGAGVAITAGAAIVIGVPVGIYSNKYQERSNKIESELNKISGIKLKFNKLTAFKKFEQLSQEFDDLTKKKDIAGFTNYFEPIFNNGAKGLDSGYEFVIDKVTPDTTFKAFTIDYSIQNTSGSLDKSNIRAVEIKGFTEEGWLERVVKDIDIKPYNTKTENNIPPSTVYTFDFVKEAKNIVDESAMKQLVSKYASYSPVKDDNNKQKNLEFFNDQFEELSFERNQDTGNWVDTNEDQDSVTISFKIKRKNAKEGELAERIVKRTLKGTGWFASPQEQLKQITFADAVVNSSSELTNNKSTFEVFDSIFANPSILTGGDEANSKTLLLNAPLEMQKKPSAEISESFGKTKIDYEIDFRNSKIFADKIVLRLNLIFTHPDSLQTKIVYPKDLEITGFQQSSDIKIANYFSSKLFNIYNGFDLQKATPAASEASSPVTTADGDARPSNNNGSGGDSATTTEGNDSSSTENNNASAEVETKSNYVLRKLRKDSTIKSGATINKATLEQLVSDTSSVSGTTDVIELLNKISTHLDSVYSTHPLKNLLQSALIFNNRDYDFKQPEKFRNILIGKTLPDHYWYGYQDKAWATANRYDYDTGPESYFEKPMWFMWQGASSIDYQATYAYIKSLPKDQRLPFIKMMFDTPSMRSQVLKRNITLKKDFTFYNSNFYPAYDVEEIAPNGVYARNGRNADSSNPAYVWRNFQEEWLSKSNPTPEQLLDWINNVMSRKNIDGDEGIVKKFDYVPLNLAMSDIYPNGKQLDRVGFNPGLFNAKNLTNKINEWLDKKDPKYSTLAKMLQLQEGYKAIPVFSNIRIENKTDKIVLIDLKFAIYRDGEALTETTTVSIPFKVSEIESFEQTATPSSNTSNNSQNTQPSNNASANTSANARRENTEAATGGK